MELTQILALVIFGFIYGQDIARYD